ncbi:MAG: dienelactone hydrolase family protein [Caldilineaceae bacterium]
MDRIYVMELVRSFQVGVISRREFSQRALAAVGSAAAVNLLLAACKPISPEAARPVVDATATNTPPEEENYTGLTTGPVEYPAQDGSNLSGYLARPEGDGAHPAVVVIQEWWGLNDHIKDVARRFAEQGYAALAPDLYHGVVATEPDEARKLVMALDMPNAVQEIQQAISYLLDQDFVSGDKVGIVGFCMGGGLVLQTALASDNLAAAVAFYGSPLSPEQAAQVKAPVLGLYGGADQGIPADAVNAMAQAMQDAGIESDFHIYDGAQHAFFNDTRESSYDPTAAADAWQRTLAWFSEHLGA